MSETQNRKLNTHNNFLARVGDGVFNLKDLASFSIPKGYRELLVYVFGRDISIKKIYSLPEGSTETINLCHGVLKDGS